MIDEGSYTREATNFFELFFYVDTLKANPEKADENGISKLTSPTFYAANVSMVNQRLGTGDEAMMVSTVGSFGNHAHANGISMELFANNYVLGPDMGKGPSYWHPAHKEFYAHFPAHNTVIVDGKSDYAAMRSYHPFTLDNVYPAPGKTPAFDKLTFSEVSFLEPETVSDQQRFTALIKSNSPSGKGYVVDVFRSKKQKEGKQKHEYLYHNLGQSLEFTDTKGNPLNLASTEELSTEKGDEKGYDYFSEKKKAVSSQELQALFRLKSDGQPDNLMKVWIKGSKDQGVFSLKSPKSNALSEGTAPKAILDEPLPTLLLRKSEAAWENPFALVFNPYIEGGENPIDDVAFSSLDNYPNTQLITVSLADKNTVDNIVLNASENDIAAGKDMYQEGLLSITRQTKTDNALDFLFLSGMYKYENEGWNIVSSGEAFTSSIVKTETGYSVHTDKPITINMPYEEGKAPAVIQLYQDGKLVSSRKGTKNRNNSKQLVFKIEKEYDQIEIVL